MYCALLAITNNFNIKNFLLFFQIFDFEYLLKFVFKSLHLFFEFNNDENIVDIQK